MKMIFTWVVMLNLYSCATSSIHSEAQKEVTQPYGCLLTLYIEKPFTLQKFDSAFYTNSIRDRFNELRTLPVRTQMEKTLKRNLSYRATRVISSSDLFKVNEDIDYAFFRERLDSAKAEALLLINEDQYWETYRYNRSGSTLQKESQPNSAFHCYLIDAATGLVLWLGRCTVQGVFAGYENLNNILARRVTRILKEKGYIL